jgi:hypothetical protein
MVEIRIPKLTSTDMAVGVLGTTSGILSSAYIGRATVSAAHLTGNAALAAGIGVKAAMGVGSIWAAGKVGGLGSTGLGLLGVGCFASMAIDLIDRIFPQATASLKLGAPVSWAVAAPIRVRPGVQAVPVTAPPIGIEIKR